MPEGRVHRRGAVLRPVAAEAAAEEGEEMEGAVDGHAQRDRRRHHAADFKRRFDERWRGEQLRWRHRPPDHRAKPVGQHCFGKRVDWYGQSGARWIWIL